MSVAAAVTLLDGGMGRQLSRMGAPFRLPEWSALALMQAPEFVGRAHAAFIGAGAEVITTNTYGLAPSRIGAARFATEGLMLADRAGRLARHEAERASAGPSGVRVRVAGSLPPMFETYQPSRFNAEQAPDLLAVLVAGLAPHVDHWLIETQGSTRESGIAIDACRRTGLPVWVSYTLRDEAGRTAPPALRSGESVTDVVTLDLERGVDAVLFNCSQPEVMNAAVLAAAAAVAAGNRPAVPIGVYANAFAPEPPSDAPYAGISVIRDDVTPQRYLDWALEWVASGASIIGGCCGIGPEHIAALRGRFARVIR